MIFQEKYTTTDLKVLGQLSINSKITMHKDFILSRNVSKYPRFEKIS